jgi:hypothetical protein
MGALLNGSGDLEGLSTSKARDLARTLAEVLEEVEFDRLNRELQQKLFGRNYDIAPYPFHSPPERAGVDRFIVRRALESYVQGFGLKMTMRQKHGFEFFMFAESLRREELELLFGELRRDRIDDFLNSGLFVQTDDQRFRMNGLSILSKRLGRENDSGKVIYILADSLYRVGPEQDRLERVYVGSDSYDLVNKQQNLDWLSGTGIDMGSGSGIQLIAALKLFPSLRKMVGFEKDRRAINVSKFNAYLNGVGDRVAIVGNESELKAAIEADGNQVDFALSNPPFMPIPESIDIDPEDVQILSNAKAFRIVDKESAPKISLREMWPMSGWGGADGLTVFRPMLEILFPILKPSGRIIAYGQFAGNAIGPTKIEEFIESVGGWQYGWDPLKLSKVPIDNTWILMPPFFSAESEANFVIRRVIGGYPELTLLLHTDFMMRYTEKIMTIYHWFSHRFSQFEKRGIDSDL